MTSQIDPQIHEAICALRFQLAANEAILDTMLRVIGEIAPELQYAIASRLTLMADAFQRNKASMVSDTPEGESAPQFAAAIDISIERWRRFASAVAMPPSEGPGLFLIKGGLADTRR